LAPVKLQLANQDADSVMNPGRSVADEVARHR